MAEPSAETFSLYDDLWKQNGYRLVDEFKDVANFRGISFKYEPLKFDLAFTNLEVSIYQRSQEKNAALEQAAKAIPRVASDGFKSKR